MAMETALVEALKSLQAFLERRKKAKTSQTEKHRRAVQKVLTAVLETEAYLFDLKSGTPKSRDKETVLSKRWVEASASVRAVDARLSKIAQVRAFGWANPDLLADARQKDVHAELELVRRQCEWLLKQWD